MLCIHAMCDHTLVRLILMHVLQFLLEQPNGGIEPMQDGTTSGKPHIQ